MAVQTILLASDLSARSDRPTDRAVLLAEQLDARLVLLHVVERDASADGLEGRATAAAQSILDQQIADVEVIVRRGDVQQNILNAVSEIGAGLVVTGVARHNNIGDYFLGTAVDHLVRHSPVPVLVVKRRPRHAYRRLLVATDFSQPSRQALETAARLFPDAVLTIWHGAHAAYEAWLDKEATSIEARREADEEMAQFVADPDLPGDVRSRLELIVDVGDLQQGAAERLRLGGYDLMVLGTHGRGALAHATIGSRAAELLANVDCDVLMVRGARN